MTFLLSLSTGCPTPKSPLTGPISVVTTEVIGPLGATLPVPGITPHCDCSQHFLSGDTSASATRSFALPVSISDPVLCCVCDFHSEY